MTSSFDLKNEFIGHFVDTCVFALKRIILSICIINVLKLKLPNKVLNTHLLFV